MKSTRWGLTTEQWDAAVHELRAVLEDAACRRSTVTYGEVARRVAGGRFSARSGALMDLLAEVDEVDWMERGIMIASLVVRADSGLPGEGYFVFAESVGGQPLGDREAYWRDRAEDVWRVFAEDRNHV